MKKLLTGLTGALMAASFAGTATADTLGSELINL